MCVGENSCANDCNAPNGRCCSNACVCEASFSGSDCAVANTGCEAGTLNCDCINGTACKLDSLWCPAGLCVEQTVTGAALLRVSSLLLLAPVVGFV